MYNENLLKYPEYYKRLETEKIGLDSIDVLIEDKSKFSDYFKIVDLPDEVSDGKYAFIIDPDPEVLRLTSQIKIEFLDADGNPIPIVPPKSQETILSYGNGVYEIVENRDSDGYSINTFTGRNVQMFIYDDVPHGIGKITIVGEALKNLYEDAEIPKEWKGVYNVRWTKEIFINKTKTSKNTAPIIFYNQPQAEIFESTSSYAQLVSTASMYYTETSSASYMKLESFINRSYTRGGSGNGEDSEEDGQTSYSKTYYLKSFGFEFESKHVGASIVIPTPSDINRNNNFGEPSLDEKLELLGNPTFVHLVTPPDVADTGAELYKYRTVVDTVLNSSTAIVKEYKKSFSYDDPTNDTSNTYDLMYYDFAESPYTMSYFIPEKKELHTKINSYINFKIKNLKTLSGEVSKLKIFYRSVGEDSDYKLLTEKVISNQNFLVDSRGVHLGIFPKEYENLSILFDTASYSTTTSGIISNTLNDLSLTFDSKYKLNSAKFYGTGSVLSNTSNFYKIIHRKELEFTNDTIYKLSVDIIGENYDSSTTPVIEFYLSGSSFNENNYSGYQKEVSKSKVVTNNIFGKFLFRKQLYGTGITLSDSDAVTTAAMNFKTITHQFKPDFIGNGKIVIVIKGMATWIINNLTVSTNLQKGYSPSIYNLKVSNPSTKLNDRLEFKVDFHNPVEQRAYDYCETTQSILFKGSNLVIEGVDNLLSGSMFIGNVLGAGIEMSGRGSGYVRSVGYDGFSRGMAGTGAPGFIMWSGSQNLIIGSDTYDGVGIELFGSSSSYMRFRTYPTSELDIRANSFFVGNYGNQFISGSGGNIEISSSKFHLKPNGDVMISGSIYALEGQIGGFTIGSSSLYSGQLFISGSPTLAHGYDSTANMFISTSYFNVKSNGDITASNALFNGTVKMMADDSIAILNGDPVALSSDLDFEFMKINFQYVSWAQFAIFDTFVDDSKRAVGDLGTAVVSFGELKSGDGVSGSQHIFNSKVYTNITTLYSGSGVGSLNTFDATGQSWFLNEVKNLNLSASGTFTVLQSSASIMTVSGTPTTGNYTLYTELPQYCVGFLSYKDSTNGTGEKYKGYIKYEFSADSGSSYITLLDTRPGSYVNNLSSTISFDSYGNTPGRDFCVRLTLINDNVGNSPFVQNFLVATDPSMWRF